MRKATFFVLTALLFIFAAVLSVHAQEGGVAGSCVENAYVCDGPGKGVTYGPCNSTVCSVCPKDSLAYKTMCKGNETEVEVEGEGSWLDKLISYIEHAFQSLFGGGVSARNCITSALGNPPECSDDNNACEPTTVNNKLLGDCAGVSSDNKCIPCQK